MDEWVSGGILASGVWEKEIVVEVMRTMDKYPEAVFMDIGSNIGHYIIVISNIPYGQSSAKLPVILSSCHPVILSSCHPVILSSGHPVILSSGHPI